MVLRDGATAHIRPIVPADADLLRAFYDRVSDESKYYRFFAPYPRLSDRTWPVTQVDYRDRLALIVLVGGDMIAVGRYERTSHSDAEVAFLVEDGYQGRGLGQLLLEHLAQTAREHGITRFTAEVLPDNRKMIAVFTEAGYHVARVRGRRDRGGVRDRADRHVVRRDAGPGATLGGAVDRAAADPVQHRGDRRQLADGTIGNALLHNLRRWVHRQAVRGQHRGRGRDRRCRRTGRSPTSPAPSTWPWWRCRPTPCRTWC